MSAVETNQRIMKEYRDYWDQLDIQRGDWDFNRGFLDLYGDDIVLRYCGSGVVSGPYSGKDDVFEAVKKTVDVLMASSWSVRHISHFVGEDGFCTLHEIVDSEGILRSHWMYCYRIRDGLIREIDAFLGWGSAHSEDFDVPNVPNWY